MKLYNTLTKKIELVESPDEKTRQIGLYACGPTVYDYTHLGHLRKYTMDDVLIRALRYEGYKVTHVQNITDVGHLSDDADSGEDKLEKGAKKYGQSVWDIAHKFENYFWHSLDLMGVAKPDVSCRATEHIEQQLEMVKTLEKKGFTYVIDGDGVYFDTSKLDDYGKLARLNIEKLKAGAGAHESTLAGKKNITDFALWKFERPGENRAMIWPSPWHERSFPGWHIECSAMGMHYLGEQFDIHTGGIDHIPVHHTNEIAQAEAATGKKPFVKVWVHHNFLQVEGEKMSKSLGNFYTIDDITKRGFAPMALRLLFLTSHYRSEMNFTWDNLAGSQKAWLKLAKTVLSLKEKANFDVEKSPASKDYVEKFAASIGDDLNTAEALAAVWEMLKDEKLSDTEKYFLLLDFDGVLGLGLEKLTPADLEAGKLVPELSDQDQKKLDNLLSERLQARNNQDWSKADELRQQIAALGFKVIDKPSEQEIAPL